VKNPGDRARILRFVVLLSAAGMAFATLGAQRASSQSEGCSAGVARYDVAVPGHPFSVAATADGRSAFVSINSANPSSSTGIGVLLCVGGRFQYQHMVPLEPQPTGLALTHDGKLLVAADDGFVTFVDTDAALAGKPAIVGYVQDLAGDPEDNDPGSVYVNVSPDDRFVFVSDEQNLTITVIDLAKARRDGFNRGAIVGTVPVGNAPIALTFSPDGRYLYTTSEIGRRAYGWPASCRVEGSPSTNPATIPPGAVITIDATKAGIDPANAVVSKVASDCSPVRLTLSPDGATIWVSNRASNTVTVFSTENLISNPTRARVATIAVGSNPVAIAVTRDGRYVLVGNSNRFGAGGTTGGGTVSIIDAGSKTVAGTITVGAFPREFSRGAGTTLFLSNNRSNTLTVFDESRVGELLTKVGARDPVDALIRQRDPFAAPRNEAVAH
jgi:YVTN family beta-propeller protein